MSRLCDEDGVDGPFERGMSLAITSGPKRPTVAQVRALRAGLQGEWHTATPQTMRLLVRRAWVAWTNGARHVTAAGRAALARAS